MSSSGALDALMKGAATKRNGSGKQEAAQAPSKKKAKTGATAPSKPSATSKGGSSFIQCPLCSKDIHRFLIEAHTAGCEGIADVPAAASGGAALSLTTPLPAVGGPAAPEPPSEAPAPPQPMPSQARAEEGLGAFAAIMGTPQSPRQHTLWLQLAPQQGGPLFHATWEPHAPRKGLTAASGRGAAASTSGAAAPTVAWRCSVMVKDDTSKLSPIELNVVLSADASAALCAQSAAPEQDGGAPDGARAGQQQREQRPPAPSAPRNVVTLLKSAVQKNVRLTRPEQAARCFRALIEADPVEALRRIVVICIEDGILHPELPTLVWAMAALSKGFALSEAFRRELVRIAFAVAACPVRDRLTGSEPRLGRPGPRSVSDPALEDAESGPGREGATLVRCILLRAEFGGMPGDRDMLRDFASAWLWRLSAGGPAPPPLPTSAAAGAAKAAAAGGPAAGGAAAEQPRSPWLRFLWDLHDDLQPQVALGPLQRADVPSTAADFHCCNILDMTMQDQRLGPEDFAALVRAHGCQPGAGAQAALKSCIWMWRSSTNNKRAVRVGSGGGGGGGGVGAAASGYESGDDGDGHEQQGALWEAWKVIEPVVQMAAQRYVASTLASIGVTR